MNRGVRLRKTSHGLTVYSLFDWVAGNDYIVGGLVRGFKQGHCLRAAENLASLLVTERILAGDPPRKPIFVVPPPRQNLPLFRISRPEPRLDHASVLGEALASIWQSPALICLESLGAENGQQKGKDVSRRAERRYRLPSDSLLPSKEEFDGSTIIFVDDVITTGSTAFAAYMALGDPRNFEVWAIANRPKLAGHSPL